MDGEGDPGEVRDAGDVRAGLGDAVAHEEDLCAGAPGGGVAGGSILQHQAGGDRHAQELGGFEVGVGIGLTVLDVAGGDDHWGNGDAGILHAHPHEFDRRGGHQGQRNAGVDQGCHESCGTRGLGGLLFGVRLSRR